MKHSKHRHHSRFHRRRSGRFNKSFGTGFAGRTIYRSRHGLFMGVCRGIAEHFHFSVFGVRLVVLFLFFLTGFWPVGVIYIVAGLLMKMAPAIPLQDEKEHEFYQSYTASRTSAIQRIKRKFDNIDRRIQRMEDTVTAREFEL